MENTESMSPTKLSNDERPASPVSPAEICVMDELHTNQPAILSRRVSKQLLERKRRAKINEYLDRIKDVVLEDQPSTVKNQKLEKTDILRLAVNYLEARSHQQTQRKQPNQRSSVNRQSSRPPSSDNNNDSNSLYALSKHVDDFEHTANPLSENLLTHEARDDLRQHTTDDSFNRKPDRKLRIPFANLTNCAFLRDSQCHASFISSPHQFDKFAVLRCSTSTSSSSSSFTSHQTLSSGPPKKKFKASCAHEIASHCESCEFPESTTTAIATTNYPSLSSSSTQSHHKKKSDIWQPWLT